MFPATSTLSASTAAPHILRLALNRPDAANALNRKMGEELADIFHIITTKSNDYRAIILTGEGKHFCAGADLKERKGMNEEQWHEQHHAFEKAVSSLYHCPLPVIAAVNGSAFGGGLELALACDFIYAAEHARFGLPEATLGIMPGMGGTQQLPRAAGYRQAREWLFTGKPFSAQDAYRAGMVNRVCAPSELAGAVLETAQAIADAAPLAVQRIKRATREGMAMPMEEAMACELKYYHTLLNTRDRHEGINAFNEKRKPSFTGA